MGVYTSTHSGAELDEATTRALPTGILSTGKQDKINIEGVAKFDGEGNASL